MTEASDRDAVLQRLLWPRSVAVIGASDDPNKVGGRPLHFMQRFGFRGQVLPINPHRSKVQGLTAHPNLDALGAAPDVAIIAVAGNAVMQAVQACTRRGVGTAIVMASGFGELGTEGLQAQTALVSAAREGGMRLIGPNAQGVANFANGAVLNFSTMFTTVEPLDGPIAIISQSGAASVVPFAHLRASGHGVRYVVASGNDADLGVSELCCAIAADEAIRLLLVYVETLPNPAMLARAAEIAARRGAAIVLLKAGNSAKGAQAAQTHTGAMLGNDAAIDAFARRHGIWRVRDLRELIRAVPLYLQGGAPGRGRTVVMTPSGAVGVLCADTAERIGLELPELAPATVEALEGVLPSFATAANPLDLTAGLLGNPLLFPRALDAIASDPSADMLMIGLTIAGPGYDVQGMVADVARIARARGKPVAVAAPLSETCALVQQAGLPAYNDESEALRCLLQYSRHHALIRGAGRGVAVPSQVSVQLPAAAGPLSEYASLQLLQEAGLCVYAHRLCRDVGEAVAAFRALGGGAVVVKACAADVPHKSDFGLVHLGLQTVEAVAQAAQACFDGLARMHVSGEGVIVGAMAPRGGHEFALGVQYDPAFGHVLMVAEGGTLIELRRDRVPLLVPCCPAEAHDAVRRLRIAPLLDGVRHGAALDAQSLVDAIVAIGRFAAAAGPRLRSLDINPLLVLPQGQGVMALDAVADLQDHPA